jgi:hypothetical protein
MYRRCVCVCMSLGQRDDRHCGNGLENALEKSGASSKVCTCVMVSSKCVGQNELRSMRRGGRGFGMQGTQSVGTLRSSLRAIT